jgi:hypothetical protein
VQIDFTGRIVEERHKVELAKVVGAVNKKGRAA